MTGVLLKKVLLKIFLLVGFVLPSVAVSYAQANPYWINFETGKTHPAVKSYASTDTVLADSIPWKMPGVYLGTMTANDFANGNHAARFRLTNNTSGSPAFMELLQDMPLGIQTIEFFTAMYGTETGGQLLVSYSTDSGQTWLPAGDTVFVTATNDSAMKVTLIPALQQPARIKIEKLNTDDSRIDVDDISISRFGTGNYVLIQRKMPEGTQVSIYTDTLKMVFDHPVSAYHGQLLLYGSGGNLQTINIPSSQIMVADSSVLISGIQLQDNSHYYVLLTDSAFVDTAHQLFSMAVVDSTFWEFETEDTIMAPPIPPLEELSESFLACNEAQNLMGVFFAYSVKGNQDWQCSNDGHEDSFSVAISGGFGQGVSAENEDWLISRLPFDLSGIEMPVLRFWQKGIYEGNVVRSVRISTNYSGSGSPVADSVSWLTLNIPGINQEPEREWHLLDGIDLSAYKNQPFYLAFTYSCGVDGAYKLFYDDIHIGAATGILNQESPSFSVKVLGIPEEGTLRLQLQAQKKGDFRFSVYDLLGQRWMRMQYRAKKGLSYPRISLPDLSSGIYLLRISSRGESTILRFLKP